MHTNTIDTMRLICVLTAKYIESHPKAEVVYIVSGRNKDLNYDFWFTSEQPASPHKDNPYMVTSHKVTLKDNDAIFKLLEDKNATAEDYDAITGIPIDEAALQADDQDFAIIHRDELDFGIPAVCFGKYSL